jgi:hypothetical protein
MFASHTIRAESFDLDAHRAHVRLHAGVSASPAKVLVDEGIVDLMTDDSMGDIDIVTAEAPVIIRAASGVIVKSANASHTSAETEIDSMEAKEEDGAVELTLSGGGPTITVDASHAPVLVRSPTAKELEALEAVDGLPLPSKASSKSVSKRRLTLHYASAQHEKHARILDSAGNTLRLLHSNFSNATSESSLVAPPSTGHAAERESRKAKKKSRNVDVWLGSRSKELKLHDILVENFKRLPEILAHHSHDAWVIQLSYSGEIFPKGSWQITNAPPFIYTGPGRLSLASARFLDPVVIRMDLLLDGYFSNPPLDIHGRDAMINVYQLLRTLTIETLEDTIDHIEHFPLYYVPLDEHAPRVRYHTEKKALFVKALTLDDLPVFAHACAVCGLFALILGSVLMGVAVFRLLPFLQDQQDMMDMDIALSHRVTNFLRYKEMSWRILAFQTFRPALYEEKPPLADGGAPRRVQLAGFAIMVSWGKRPNSNLFARYALEVSCNRPGPHKVCVSANKDEVPASKLNPEMAMLCVPINGTETRETLRVGSMYRVKITAKDVRNSVIEVSKWSNPIMLEPWRPIALFPFMLVKVFCPCTTYSLKFFFKTFM